VCLAAAGVGCNFEGGIVPGLGENQKCREGGGAGTASGTELARWLVLEGLFYLDYTPDELVAEFESVDRWGQKRDGL
jgi:hypothetical protein